MEHAVRHSREERIQEDGAIFLSGSFETKELADQNQPVEVLRVTSHVAKTSFFDLPAFQDAESFGRFTSTGESYVSDYDEADAHMEDIYDILTELLDVYDLQTCLFCFKDAAGERLSIVNRESVNEVCRASKVMSAQRFRKLIVAREIPTIVYDLFADPRFNGYDTELEMVPRFYVQMPVGLVGDGTYIGTLNAVGRHANHNLSLDNFEVLSQRATQIAEIIGGKSGIERQYYTQ